MRTLWLLPAVLVVCVLPACSRSSTAVQGDDAATRAVARFEKAWGPESPETLQKFLDLRRALKPVFDKNEEGVTQWALREASTRPGVGRAMFGVLLMRQALNEQLKKTGLTDEDYQRLTLLVYGRWLRAVRDGDPPEKRLLRVLQEEAIAAERHLANAPPSEARDLTRLQDRVASTKFQAKFIAPYALADKKDVLARIDKGTAAWLEQHRKEIEECDFGVLDSAPPSRSRPPGPKPQPDAAPPEARPDPAVQTR